MNEEVAAIPEVQHIIGKTQNHSESIPLFLWKNARDPAIKVIGLLGLIEKLYSSHVLDRTSCQNLKITSFHTSRKY